MNQTAQGLASFGRGPDSMLVHMAPGEVKSLQQLAMAHGGSLTINPETGLPEAGFLSSLLPMLIGGGLTIASGGALSPVMAGLLTGGGVGLATGSLKKGLMAGFGAYGGAGLGSALAGSGVQAAANTQIAGDAAYKTAQEAMQQQATALGQNAAGMDPTLFADKARSLTAPLNTMQDAALTSQQTAFANASPFERLQTAGSGISNLTSGAGRDIFMQNIGGSKGLMQAGLAAASPMMMDTTTKQPEIKTDKDMGQRYQFNAGSQTPTPVPDVPGYENQGINFGKEQRYFNPMYRPIDNPTAKKLYGFASGGPVEAMSDANAIGMNTGYPQADIETGAYATPYQQPISRDMLPYPGQPQFAEGGAVDSYTYDPTTQMYVKKSGEGATMVSPTGGISGASGGGDSYSPSGPPPTTTPEEFAAQSARNQQINDFLTNLSKNSLTSMAMRGLESILGGISEARGQAAVGSYGGGSFAEQNAMQAAMSSPNTGVGIPGESPTISSESGPTGNESATDYGGTGGAMLAQGGLSALAQGGISHLGDYSDGGRLLRGPGDGISDSIPAMIGKKQPARLADGEFVVPARIVSELGNGSTEAGARKLYAMMDRVQKARKKTVGEGKVAANSRSAKYLPA